ncbi:hypothetical protein HPB47_009728 [Ixodes persulcatus]|uniref:Uncharacterized protein n=1 Tax=Ixodes persulcatus TaxID=34615 RepID=A0AC60P147_IXOPE|nr:hypothetical protein HPB47_009728 [Ixodes persulcatus]
MDHIKRTRGVIRSVVTRTLNALTDLLRGTDPDFTDLQVHLDFLLQKEAQLKDLDNEIRDLLDDEYLENEVVGTLEYNMNISHTLEITSPAIHPKYQTTVQPSVTGIKFLPEQEVWPTYPLAKHHAPLLGPLPSDDSHIVELPRIEKFKYLQSYLTGPAKQAIEWVRLSDEGYDVAIKALLERFGRSSLLVDKHIDQLLALSPVNSSNNIAELRHLYDSIQFRTSCLEGLGVPPTQYAVVLKRVLMRSLPNDLAVLFRQNIKEKESPTEAGDMQTTTGVPGTAEVANILMFLRIQIESREESQGGLQWSSPDPPQEDRGGTRPSSAQHSLPSALALPTSSVAPEPGSCPLCTGIGHQLQDCNTNISSDTKRNRLRSARCCYRCGKVNHVARNCRTSTRLVCGTCSGRHITILCDIWRFPQDESRPSFTGVSESRTDENRGLPNNVTTAPTTSTGVSSVLLQTAKAWATGTTDSALVRVLLDTGSQRTFIKRESSERLRCQVLGTEELTIYTFGNTKRPTHYRCRRVELTLQSQYSTSKVTVEALEVLQADTEVGVLIGSDVYWKVATGQIRRLSDHLTAVHTIFGWMVQGRYMCPTSDRSNTTAVSTTSCETSHSESRPVATSEMWQLDAIGISDLPSSDPATRPALLQFNEQFVKRQNGDSARVYAGVVFSEASTVSDALVKALHQRSVSVPSGSPKKELLVKLYRQHVLNNDRFTSGDYSSDEDVRDTSKEHDDSCTLPGVSDSFTSLSDDALLAKPRDFGFQAGPVVASTRSPYERQLRQLLKNGSVPANPSVPTDEFSATEEEEPRVIPEDNSDDEDGGTPLQKGPMTFSPPSVRSVRFNLSNSNSPGVNEAVQPSRRSFTCSARSSSLPQYGSPVHMTLRSRAGTRGEDMAGHSAATAPAVGKQRRMYTVVKVLIVLVVTTVNVLIHLRAPVEQGSFKTNILISRSRIAPIKPNISSAPNCVVRNDGVKRHIEEPDLLPTKKRNPKVVASIEPTVNLGKKQTTESKERQTTDCREQRKTKDRAMQTKTRLLHRTSVLLPMTPRAVTEQGKPLPSTTAEPETKSEPHSTTRRYAAIAFQVLELDAQYCRNMLGYKEDKVQHHSDAVSTTGRRRGHRRRRQYASSAMETWSGNEDVLRQAWRDLSMHTTILQRLGTTPSSTPPTKEGPLQRHQLGRACEENQQNRTRWEINGARPGTLILFPSTGLN